MHLEHKAGDKLYIDFAGNRLSILDVDDGEIREIEVFVVVLGCSQLTYEEAVYSKKNEDMVRACENALHYYGGVPTAIVADKLRSAVSKSSRYEPVINETFADFAEHYSTVVLPARAYRPKDKALVEAMVKIIYRSIYTLVNREVYTMVLRNKMAPFVFSFTSIAMSRGSAIFWKAPLIFCVRSKRPNTSKTVRIVPAINTDGIIVASIFV